MRFIILIILLLSNLLATTSKFDELFLKEAVRFNLPFELLKAIAITESALNPNAININSNGSFDIGIMQINSIHLKRYKNLTKENLLKPNVNIYVGAEILSTCREKYGLNYKMLNCYNGKIENNDYSNKVIANLKKVKYDTLSKSNGSIFK